MIRLQPPEPFNFRNPDDWPHLEMLQASARRAHQSKLVPSSIALGKRQNLF